MPRTPSHGFLHDPLQMCAGKCVTTRSLGRKLKFVAFANFCGVNTPTLADFKLPTRLSLNKELGRDGCNWLSWACASHLQHTTGLLPHFIQAFKCHLLRQTCLNSPHQKQHPPPSPSSALFYFSSPPLTPGIHLFLYHLSPLTSRAAPWRLGITSV